MVFSILVILVVSDVQKGKMVFSIMVILVVSAVQKDKMVFSILVIHVVSAVQKDKMVFSILVILVVSAVQKDKMVFSIMVILVAPAVQGKMDFSIKVILVVSAVQKNKMVFSIMVILVVPAVQKGKMDFSIKVILVALVKCRVSLLKALNLTCLQDFSMSEAPMIKQKEMSGQESEIIKRNDMPCVRLRDLPWSMVQVQLRHNLKHVARVLVPQGMQQLQKAQLDHFEKAERKREDEAPEQCKPGTTSLPSLQSPSGNESAVALQDWIEVIDGPLRDISDSSSWWWDAVKERAQESYRKWVALGPPTADDLEKGKFSRLSARTAGMMLQAMTESVRTEMVARAITRSPVALLFRLCTMYQPGGESEKAYILQYLVSPPKAQQATELVTVLRQWERLLLRADNLNIAKPDPSLLVRGLNNLVSEVWAKDKDVGPSELCNFTST
eukprot:s10981_g1.t1